MWGGGVHWKNLLEFLHEILHEGTFQGVIFVRGDFRWREEVEIAVLFEKQSKTKYKTSVSAKSKEQNYDLKKHKLSCI